MRWRDASKEMPKCGQKVWVLLHPHKVRGDWLDSAESIQILAGEACETGNGMEVDNGDELGLGGICWKFEYDYSTVYEHIRGWMPLEEMIYPDFPIE